MFNKLLIANRGEIACRVIDTARAMGLHTIAVFSEADRGARHAQLADEAVCIGGMTPEESYLRIDVIIDAAQQSGARAIHPGYGFLSENPELAAACERAGIVFVGPPQEAIRSMGSKSTAKALMEKAGVPLVPGYHGDNQDPVFLKQQADAIGYPVLLKAVAGGGGKGMRPVYAADEFEEAVQAAGREARSAFGDARMLIERYVQRPRHVEVQVFFDTHGNGVYLFERDCSVQRRHQKIIEEAPAPGLDEALRRELGEAAVAAGRAIGYVGAGTVEFLLDGDRFYFTEMNTRLQVEHPVTEMITGEDLVEWQLRVAAGEPLPKAQDQLRVHGHAFEARVYAEDPAKDFMPATGRLHYVSEPPQNEWVRVDTGVQQGDEILPFYDPMIAKLIVWGEDRRQALNRLLQALSRYRIAGLVTNIPFLSSVAGHEAFRAAELSTGFIDEHRDTLFARGARQPADAFAVAALAYIAHREQQVREAAESQGDHSPWGSLVGWRLNKVLEHHVELCIDDEARIVTLKRAGAGWQIDGGDGVVNGDSELSGSDFVAEIDGRRQQFTLVVSGYRYTLFGHESPLVFDLVQPETGEFEGELHGGLVAPMNGRVTKCLVQQGQQVDAGEALVVMEAMKMEYTIRAAQAGEVTSLACAEGDLVSEGDVLVIVEAEERENAVAE